MEAELELFKAGAADVLTLAEGTEVTYGYVGSAVEDVTAELLAVPLPYGPVELAVLEAPLLVPPVDRITEELAGLDVSEEEEDDEAVDVDCQVYVPFHVGSLELVGLPVPVVRSRLELVLVLVPMGSTELAFDGELLWLLMTEEGVGAEVG